jgi:chromosomal replication initiation ATPase DnaA
MREGARQLVLDLPVEARFGRDEFLVSASNEAAFRLIERWPDWSDPLLQLAGPAGSGKSHLAAIWAARSGARVVAAADVALAAVPDLAAAPALVIEDVDRRPVDEPALFHLVNRAREAAVPVLFTAAQPLGPGLIATPDLLSRLRRAPRVELGPPDDALLRAVFVKLFADRQLVVDPNVVEYLVVRIERSLARAAEIVAIIDHEALARGRRITRAVAAGVLEAHAGAAEPDVMAEDEEPSSGCHTGD